MIKEITCQTLGKTKTGWRFDRTRQLWITFSVDTTFDGKRHVRRGFATKAAARDYLEKLKTQDQSIKIVYVKMFKACSICEQSFQVKPSNFEWRKYCSMKCMAIGYKEQMSGENNPNYKISNDKICSNCGVAYHSHTKRRKYCSQTCAAKVNSKKPRKPYKTGWKRTYTKPIKTAKCKVCSVDICRRLSYCSSCRKQRGIYNFQCRQCGKNFTKKNIPKAVFCSYACRNKNISERQKGELSHLWQGGRTDKIRLIRNSADYDNWRKSVYRRDDFTCQMCFQKGGKLSAHHILVFSKFPQFAFDVWNGITLCWSCHTSINHKENEYVFDFLKITFQIPENSSPVQILSELPKPLRLCLLTIDVWQTVQR